MLRHMLAVPACASSRLLAALVLLGVGCPAAPVREAAGLAPDAVPTHETFSLESQALGETRRINVYTPPGHAPAGAIRYPIFYMPDGGTGGWLASHAGLTATFYFTTAGDDDLGDAGATLAATLRRHAPATLTWFYEPMPSELHSTIYRAVAPIALRKVFPAAVD
jgi:hypothetical protein